MLPEDVYANESALITQVTSTVDINNARINYNVTAIGDTAVSLASQFSWGAIRGKPSEIICSLIDNNQYHLKEIFYGMKNRNPFEFIDSDDKIVNVPAVTNKPIMDYISTLVSYMVPTSMAENEVIQNTLYTLATYEDTTGKYGGPYFEVRKMQKGTSICSYVVDIGYPSAMIVENFSVKTNNNWSIFYDYNKEASSTDYVRRLNSKGELEYIYNPQLTNGRFDLEENDKTWWTKMTEFPIEATMTIRGLLRPAILMSYLKINV